MPLALDDSPPSVVFHFAGVAEDVAAGILAHDYPTMTFGLYSGGASLAAAPQF